MKKPKSNTPPDWGKRSAMQYAYAMSMGIHPDEIAKIEEERSLIRDKALDELPESNGLLENIEAIRTIEESLPKYPEVPPEKLSKFVYFKERWYSMYSRPSLPIGSKAREYMDKALSDYLKEENK